MTIARVDAWTKALPLTEPVGFQGQFYGDVPVAFVRIRTEDKAAGMGCAVPALDVSDADLEAMGAALTEATARLVGRDPLHRRAILDELEGPARTAVDLALCDLLGQAAGMPLHLLWGSAPLGVVTSRGIAPMGTGATVSQAKALVAEGTRALRIEAFGDAEIDAQRLLRVRDELGPDIGLALHATGTHADLHALCAECGPVGLDYIAVGAIDPRRLSRLSYGLPAPLAVRCASADDALRFTAAGVSLLHVSLQAVGGIAELSTIAAIARSRGARLVLAAGPEPAISIAAATHFALGEPAVAFAELDGHLGFSQDPTAGCVVWTDGELRPTERPGLGWAKPKAG
ncbi:MAG: hypothetical protein EP330_05445 [Deltaproteobacteria bacterium]|nr:MAG: hypothetical protein EP330_05445 [Deltaproteobacteria bacterium]